MHLKLKDFGSLIDCNCRISRDKNLICTELCQPNGLQSRQPGHKRNVNRKLVHEIHIISVKNVNLQTSVYSTMDGRKIVVTFSVSMSCKQNEDIRWLIASLTCVLETPRDSTRSDYSSADVVVCQNCLSDICRLRSLVWWGRSVHAARKNNAPVVS